MRKSDSAHRRKRRCLSRAGEQQIFHRIRSTGFVDYRKGLENLELLNLSFRIGRHANIARLHIEVAIVRKPIGFGVL